MNLTDQETLELGSLCDAVVDGTLTEAQQHQLTTWLATSQEARQFYVRTLSLSASLYTYASETLANSPDEVWVPIEQPNSSAWKWIAPLALAASLVLAFWVVDRRGLGPEILPDTDEFVARLTAAKDCRWEKGTEFVSLGDHLHRGQTIKLAAGLAEITFDSGAIVVLEGPSIINVNSAWELALHRGTLRASVPPQAIGFRVSNSTVGVVDLGTEFSMIADGQGAADVLVLEGAVEAELHDGLEQEPLVLHENQSRRFTASGISEITDIESKFARFNLPLALERFAPPPNYVHWSFDETQGRRFESTAVGSSHLANPAEVYDVASEDHSRVHSKGHLNGSLYFDGRHRAVASFPGLSANGARTVAFWVKTPSDTQLSEAYAMAAWLPSNDRLRFRPVHICWNRNPSEGGLGVLRVDYARGFALGTTPLRNGKWHHVAVVFVPGTEACTPLQVKLYLDGRFEGVGRPSPPGMRADSTKSPEDYTREVQDTLWLGCRLGSDGPRADRFRGSMDELFVVDRELVPSEIVQLMMENRIDPVQMVGDGSSPCYQACLKEPGSTKTERL
jgi:hypothetical protein